MKLAFPHYEGDSILRPFISPVLAPAIKRVKAAELLPSNIPAINPDPVAFSSLDLDSQVRRLRREYLHEWIKGIFGRKGD